MPEDSVPEESLYEESLDEESLFEDSLAEEDRSTSQKTGVLIRAESEAGDSAKPIQGKSGFSKIKVRNQYTSRSNITRKPLLTL